jgi:hypothetical protein
MRKLNLFFVFLLLAPLASLAQDAKVFKWTDKDGVTHYGDRILTA